MHQTGGSYICEVSNTEQLRVFVHITVLSSVLHIYNITVIHFIFCVFIIIAVWHCNYDINGKKKQPIPFSLSFIDLLCLFLSWYEEINLIIPSKVYCPICVFHLHFQRPVGDHPDWQNPAFVGSCHLPRSYSLSVFLSQEPVSDLLAAFEDGEGGNVFVGTWKWRYANHHVLQLALYLWCQDYLITSLFGTFKLKMIIERGNKDETGIFHGGPYMPRLTHLL